MPAPGAAIVSCPNLVLRRSPFHTSSRTLDPEVLKLQVLLLQVPLDLQYIFRPSEITPIISVGAEGKNFFAVGSEAQVGGNDGEYAFFREHRQKARGNNMNAGKCQRLRSRGRAHEIGSSVAPVLAAAKLQLIIENKVA
jgi:hypothetical protein